MTKPQWEIEFDQKFPFAIIDWKIGKENDGDGNAVDRMKEIKNFIRSQITSSYQQGVEDMRRKCVEEIGKGKVVDAAFNSLDLKYKQWLNAKLERVTNLIKNVR